MNKRLHTSIAMALIGLSGIAVTTQASACGLNGLHMTAAHTWSLPANVPASNTLRLARITPAGSQAMTRDVPNFLQSLEPITGLYEFTFTSVGSTGIPDGTVVDKGFVTWHADGTELMNSGKPANTGDFCMGAWARTGTRTYKLNHYALNWDANGGFIGPVNIRENFQLALGNNAYAGTFSLDQFAPDGVTLLGHVQGNVSATRVTAD
ncbi:MAG: hypothetical protein ACMG50_01705 [Thermomonas sp.]